MTADEGLETVDRYMYLGLFKSNDRSCTKDHKVGISLAKQQMLQPERPYNNSQIHKLIETLAWPALGYGAAGLR